LWDVAKNLIGQLDFEECMIYMWNNDKTVLVQRAGYGLKGDMQVEQNKEGYNIPRGKGIVGAVAESGNHILVNDTSKDSRYFSADEKIMFSELSVPLLQKGKVMGVINTEHSKKKFFTEKHVKMLSIIASLCADKMEKIKAEEQTHEKEMEVLKLNKDLATSQLTTLRAQMNPHFIFNALNSVQQYILKGDISEANRYLSKFSRLQRQVLNHSSQDFIPLETELEILNLYVELERLRFEGGFTYKISVCSDIDADEIKIPPMIVQPFVENAIWHGLMPKQGERNLEIIFSLPDDDVLQCTVKDNGIGREAAAKIKSSTQLQHTSKGLSLVYDRLAILRQQYGQVFDAQIHDLTASEGQPAGTEVTLRIHTS
jgi:two-component system, LytTR family, sensor kinase